MSDTENVEVKQSKIGGAGRGLFALKDFLPGDVILSLDRPLVTEVELGRASDTCAWCLQRSEQDPEARAKAASMGLPTGLTSVKACTGCRRAVYCSKTCQSKAWKREHKYECKAVGVKDRPDLPHSVRATIKLLGRLNANPDDERVRSILSFKPAGDPAALEAVTREHKARFDDFQMLAYGAFTYAKEANVAGSDSQNTARGLLFNLMSNYFELRSPLDDVYLGVGFDPLLCSTNHSCEPNSAVVFNQPQTVMRALAPIKKGEEIFMRYVDITNPFSVRQSDLKEQYYFSCQCAKCKKGAKFPEDMFSKPPEQLTEEYCDLADTLIERHGDKLHKYYVPVNDETTQRRLAALQAQAFAVAEKPAGEEDEEELIATLKMCIESGMWDWSRQPVPVLCQKMFGMNILSGNPYRAFRLGLKRYFDITPKLYSQPFYPDRLADLWAMSTVTNVLCSPAHQEIYDEFAKNGIDLPKVYFGFLLELRDNIPKMYGTDSPFGRLVEFTYGELIGKMGRSEAEIRKLVEEVWPSLEIIARKVYLEAL